MSAGPSALPAAFAADEAQFRITVAQYDEMGRLGILDEHDEVELLEGLLFTKMSKREEHVECLRRLGRWVDRNVGDDWRVRNQDPIALVDGKPEPDLAIVTAASEALRPRRAPTPADAALVVEVADSTLAKDRGIKLRSYARSGVSLYWIVNLAARAVEVYTDPRPDADPPAYGHRRDVGAEETIALPASVGGATIRVADLLPPA